jgi:mono/diheme cytochrome c family protein
MRARTLMRLVGGAMLGAAIAAAPTPASSTPPPLPANLRDTDLYADRAMTIVRPGNLPFSPQYPLWSDGTTKRRWIRLPAATTIDASRADAWEFPRGTKLWKEFSLGRRIETRMIERLADGSWRYATYVWNADGTEAVLAPEGGASLDIEAAPAGRYNVPSRTDCLACHEAGDVPVLGFAALQLSPDRDPLAPHAEAARADQVDLRRLATLGVIRNLPQALLDQPPRIEAPTATERAALGYLHGNCGHCHNQAGALAGLDLVLAQTTGAHAALADTALGSLIGRTGRYRPQGGNAVQRVVPGSPETSVIALRMKSTSPLTRMPPLGVERIDAEGVALIERWIQHAVPTPKEPSP